MNCPLETPVDDAELAPGLGSCTLCKELMLKSNLEQRQGTRESG